jgi:chorismate mutase
MDDANESLVGQREKVCKVEQECKRAISKRNGYEQQIVEVKKMAEARHETAAPVVRVVEDQG